LVCTHGLITLQENSNEPELFDIHTLFPNMLLTKINSTDVDICIHYSHSDVLLFKSIIAYCIHNFGFDARTTVECIASHLSSLRETKFRNKTHTSLDKYYQHWLWHEDKSFSVQTFGSTNAISIDKMYLPHGTSSSGVYVVNMPNIPNVAPLITNTDHFYLSDAIRFFYNNGVKHVIWVDMSCSKIHDIVSERDARYIRRNAKKHKIFGGYLNVRKKHNKTRRIKK